MIYTWLSLLASLLPYLTSATPIPEAELIVRSIFKRDPSGPTMNGKDFPDPALLKVGSTWYSFATQGGGVHYQVATSPDFNTWTILENANGVQLDALPSLPSWATQGDPATWAPDVHQLADGTFAMTFSASVASSPAHHCVGVAKATQPQGPYTPVGNSPLICPLSAGGAIDSSYFRDPSTQQLYLVWKIDGNSIGSGGPCNQNPNPPYVPTPLRIQPVNEDGCTLSGSATTILDATQADAGIIEAPSVTKINDYYYLFYSHGCYTTSLYSVSYAYSKNLLGPYTRASRPLFQSGDYGLSGPGGATAYNDGRHLVFHGNNNGGRSLYTAMISGNAGTVTA